MKKTIRRSVFETNSSSMHSLIRFNDGMMRTGEEVAEQKEASGSIAWNEDHSAFSIVIEEYECDYGRAPFRILNEPFEKFCYIVADRWGGAYGALDDEKQQQCNLFISQMVDTIPGCEAIVYPMSSGWGECSDYTDYGSVDHQSMGIVSSYIEKHDIAPLDFIYSDEYAIIIDGDEYCEWDNLKESGTIKVSSIAEEYPVREEYYSDNW